MVAVKDPTPKASRPARVPPATAMPPPSVIISGMKLGLGGVRTHLVLLCRLLLREGAAVTMFANGSRWSDDLLDGLRAQGLRIHLPPAFLRQTPLLGMLYAGLVWPIQVPRRANSLYCLGTGRSHFWLNRLRPQGVVSINHEILEAPALGTTAGRGASMLDATVANSRRVAAIMAKSWPQKPIRVIPFLTSDSPMPPPARTARPRDAGSLRVTYLGRLVSQKRPGQLVRQWQELTASPELAGACLEVHGFDPDGRMLADLRRFVAGSSLAGRVRIHGAYEPEQLPGILAQSDLVVLPSLWEGLPLVLVEAMLHGVPFVACAAGGTEELGQDNPDVLVTGTGWQEFVAGLRHMASRVRAGQIDPRRLHGWAEARYGCSAVSRRWLDCLLRPTQFFHA